MDDKQFLSQLFADMDSAEVLTIFFPALHRSLVIDSRRCGQTGPYVQVCPSAGSTEGRLAAIGRAYPQLGPVHSILSIPWIKSVAAFREEDVLDRLAGRLIAAGMPTEDAQAACRAALRELMAAERQATADLLHGYGYRTLVTTD